MGFVLDSKLLIIAGALDGSSGLILSIIMSKAMNRSFTNVLFGAFGQVQASAAAGEEAKPVRSATPEEAAAILSAANKVVIVPGYGMAVAQAQHKVRELYDTLTKKGVDVRFAIHPVAGRMPGHMNVLLAEADIPYDRLIEMDEINGDFPQTDVALIIGANDVTNPAARTDQSSPIFGMPILDVDKAHTVMVIKRGMSPGFAGIDNPLYYLDRTLDALRRRETVRRRDRARIGRRTLDVIPGSVNDLVSVKPRSRLRLDSLKSMAPSNNVITPRSRCARRRRRSSAGTRVPFQATARLSRRRSNSRRFPR